MHVPSRNRATAVAVGLLLVLAGAPAAASAATAGVAGGSTTLKLAPGTARALNALGVAVAPLRPAKAGKAGVSFPVSGGSVDPATGAGTIEHRGGLRLRAGDTTVDLRNFVINAGSTNTIGVQVGKKRLHAFRIGLDDAKVTRRGIQTLVGNVKVTLSARGAAALNKAFGVKAFQRGLRIGTATVRVRPGELAFTGGSTSLALDPGAAQALTGLGVSVAPAAPASAAEDGAIAFPITEGKVNARTLAGSISHSGGLTFSAGATSVTVTDFVIETAPAPKLTAALGGARVDLLTLDLGGLNRKVDGRDVTLGGVVVKLTAGAAAALNQAFGTTALAEGLTIGTATVRARVA
jgi:hypothetical protein